MRLLHSNESVVKGLNCKGWSSQTHSAIWNYEGLRNARVLCMALWGGVRNTWFLSLLNLYTIA